MPDIPKEEYIISDHPLIKGQKVAPGWWTSNNKEGNIRIKDMTNEHLNNAINYMKKLIKDNRDKPEDEYPKRWLNMNLFSLEQLLDEKLRRPVEVSERAKQIMVRAGLEKSDERKALLKEYDLGYKDGYDGNPYNPTTTSYIDGYEAGQFARKRFKNLEL